MEDLGFREFTYFCFSLLENEYFCQVRLCEVFLNYGLFYKTSGVFFSRIECFIFVLGRVLHCAFNLNIENILTVYGKKDEIKFF